MTDDELLEAEVLLTYLSGDFVLDNAWDELPTRELGPAMAALLENRPASQPPLLEGEPERLAKIVTQRDPNDRLFTLDMLLAPITAFLTRDSVSDTALTDRLTELAKVVEDEGLDLAQVPASSVARSSAVTPRSIDVVPDARTGRVDLGRLLVPLVPGMTLNTLDQAGPALDRIEVSVGGDTLALELFELEEGEDWNLLRQVNKHEFEEAGREVRERLGIFGVQLQSYIPVSGGFHRLRFIGHEEPGWCLRGIVTGPAASEPTGSDAVRRLFFGTVVDIAADAVRLPQDPEHLRLVNRTTEGTMRLISPLD
ncbi:DUF3710 domain-containing protein [Catenulispora sp. GP43]|uniref:DUF3710 domain-containing protein n=1 Tax=Catenulispora sp. GP43 TaxID=3156263 RepID=UPI003517A6DD